MSTECNTWNVWLFARPPSESIPTNETADLFCWAVLVTKLSGKNIKAHALRQTSDNLRLGTLWELGTDNGLNIIELATFHEWRSFSGEFVGTTSMNNEDIRLAGITFLSWTDGSKANNCRALLGFRE